MKKNLYAMFDKEANIYTNPLVFLNHGDAIRWFTTVVNGEDNQLPSRYPNHFVLNYLGTYDDNTHKFENEHKELVHGNEVKEQIKRYTIEELFEKKQEIESKSLKVH